MLIVHLRISDAGSGKPTPVRLRISDEAGRFYSPLGRYADFPIGRGECVGGHVLVNGEKWCYIDGSCEAPLPAGVPLRIQASKGPEYTPLDETVTLGAGQISLRFNLNRWIDPRSKGWYSGDSRCHFLSPHDALLEAAGEGLDVVNLLAVEEPRGDFPSAANLSAFSGQMPALEAHDRIVAVNTLNVHPVLGQVGLLFSHRPILPLNSADWSICDWCDQCHRKGGLSVWVNAPHGGEALIAAILGKIDAIEVTDHLAATRSLRSGARILPLIGGSGKVSNAIPLGAVRTYAKLNDGEPFSYKAWIEAVRAGRSFLCHGTLRSEDLEHAVGCALPTDRSGTNSITRDLLVGSADSTARNEESLPARRANEEFLDVIRATQSWAETEGRFANPKRKQALIDHCNEALAKLEAEA